MIQVSAPCACSWQLPNLLIGLLHECASTPLSPQHEKLPITSQEWAVGHYRDLFLKPTAVQSLLYHAVACSSRLKLEDEQQLRSRSRHSCATLPLRRYARMLCCSVF